MFGGNFPLQTKYDDCEMTLAKMIVVISVA